MFEGVYLRIALVLFLFVSNQQTNGNLNLWVESWLIRLSLTLLSIRFVDLLENLRLNKITNWSYIDSKLMEAKTSELYILFQNKAHHYQNIQSARSKVEDHLSSSLNHTINVIRQQRYDRDMPLHKRHSIEIENKNMTGRLNSIHQSGQKVVLRDGSYSRFNKFERPFRAKNPFKSEEERMIQIQNDKIKQKIERMRSGSKKYWETSFKEQQKFSSKRENGELKSRSNLIIQAGPFLAKPYLQFISHMQGEDKKKLEDSKASNRSTSKDTINVQQEKLFVLPQFTNKQQRLKKSKISLSDDAEPEAVAKA